jgi:hypothetical protein
MAGETANEGRQHLKKTPIKIHSLLIMPSYYRDPSSLSIWAGSQFHTDGASMHRSACHFSDLLALKRIAGVDNSCQLVLMKRA